MLNKLFPKHVTISNCDSGPFRSSKRAIFLPFLLLPLLSACGGGRFPVAEAKGKVVCNGQPVTTGTVTFSPIGDADGGAEVGKPATATVGPDGTFVLSTEKRFDGAVVGKHRVSYIGPEGGDEEETHEAPEGSPEERAQYLEKMKKQQAQKSACVQQGEIILEVKADGQNDFTIELVPAGPAEQ